MRVYPYHQTWGVGFGFGSQHVQEAELVLGHASCWCLPAQAALPLSSRFASDASSVAFAAGAGSFLGGRAPGPGPGTYVRSGADGRGGTLKLLGAGAQPKVKVRMLTTLHAAHVHLARLASAMRRRLRVASCQHCTRGYFTPCLGEGCHSMQGRTLLALEDNSKWTWNVIPQNNCMSKATQLPEKIKANAETSTAVIWRQHCEQDGKQQQKGQEPCCAGDAASHSLLQMRPCIAAYQNAYMSTPMTTSLLLA